MNRGHDDLTPHKVLSDFSIICFYYLPSHDYAIRGMKVRLRSPDSAVLSLPAATEPGQDAMAMRMRGGVLQPRLAMVGSYFFVMGQIIVSLL
jgi:hypothetical protein